jgi:hypothetical protein
VRRYLAAQVYDRREALISSLLTGTNLVGTEIGVYKGDIVCRLLNNNSRIRKLYGIDPYTVLPDMRRNWRQKDWDRLYDFVLAQMKGFGDRFEMMRGMSNQCVPMLPELDFAEIDGDHRYRQVIRDIYMCEGKVRAGGLVCGHDYFGPYAKSVKLAVDTYAKEHNRDLHYSNPDIGMWWWYTPTGS